MMTQNGLTEAGASAPVAVPIVPDPEVPERLERARRRQFTVGYKLRILSEADAARTTGEIGALLRREGLYSSHLGAWRRGRPTSSPEQREVARLRQENERLGQRLVAAEAVIEIQKKSPSCWAWSSRAVRATSAPDGQRDRVGADGRGDRRLPGGRGGACQFLPARAASGWVLG